jgi:hypothetical protein
MPEFEWYRDTDPRALEVFLEVQRKMPVAQKFDIFPLGTGSFEQAQFEGRAPATVSLEGNDEIEVPTASAGDTLLSKLVWFRLGGEVSAPQWNDARGIAAIKRNQLDLAYLRRWAAYLKVEDLLDCVLSQTAA